MSKQSADFSTTVCGIPCGVVVDTYYYRKGNYSSQAVDPSEYYGEEEIEFTLLDRKGFVANWLYAKMADNDIEQIEEEIREHHANYDQY